MIDWVIGAFRTGGVAYIASDGNSKLGAAAWAVVSDSLAIGGTTIRDAASAFDAEIAGLRELLRVCAEAAPHAVKGAKVVPVVDCSEAITLVGAPAQGERFRVIGDRTRLAEYIRSQHVQLILQWVPSHKEEVEGLVCHRDCDNNIAHKLNDRADDCAKDIGAKAYDLDSARKIWEGEKAAAVAWMDKAFELAVVISDDYGEFVGASSPSDGDQDKGPFGP